MNIEQLTNRFFELVAPDQPNSWEVEDAVLPLVDSEKVEAVLSQVPVIWPISNSLCYNYLAQVTGALSCISESELPAWVNATLDHYESGGLRAAQRFMIDVERNFVCHMRGESGARLQDIHGWLLPYVQGLSGGGLELAPARAPYTDTGTVYLPQELKVFSREEDNILLYKLIAAYQWAFCRIGTFFPSFTGKFGNDAECSLQNFLRSFPDSALAGRLYHTLETLRAGFFLARELPGLVRMSRDIRRRLWDAVHGAKRRQMFVLGQLDQACCLFDAVPAVELQQPVTNFVNRLSAHHAGAGDSLELCQLLYERVAHEGEEPAEPLVFQGELHLSAVQAAREQQQKIIGEQFLEALSVHLLHLPEARPLLEEQMEKGEGGGRADGDRAIILEHQAEPGKENAARTLYLKIDNEATELPEELRRLVSDLHDLGVNPERYITSAVGRAGQAMARGEGGESTSEEQVVVSTQSYDEWDFRRKGFRKNWCILTEREIVPLRTNFVSATLAKYHGRIVRLRHQFEMMRTQERFLRRQRDGDDVDFDALVESLADTRAGLPPSDRLFIRLRRDERDIAVLFLLDMSNSTEGWIGTAIKESLVLLCEAMETLGDRYGIYGFSGMRRLRCETFHIKHIDESYTDEVRQRIGSITPREYTRMAPAIRHMTSLFKTVDARVRLLITLSDGKPEDYDDYKGEYAIEDTRHALLEARSAGIHPFCITIDRHAHDYMAHMYGDVNYIFINNVAKLPARMPEIYRVLTT